MSEPGYLRIGDVLPNVQCDSSAGAFDLYEYKGDGWLCLCSHPADFTPVCTTELGRLSSLVPDFAARNCKVAAISVDGAESHREWIKDINETQNTDVQYPILADPDRRVANLYGMIHPNAPDTMAGKLTVRTVFLIGPANKVRMMLTYPASTGRNFHEILRVLDSLQLTDVHKVATPVDWKSGEDVVILPNISNDEAAEKFPGYTTVKPYLRTTGDPSKQ
eukprot:TRINITY_DN11268_c0_g1_i2.p2 TRINITY_DN11268_c0_g1~~TRINITY_DN11268_c0_g1_i2.p2  ORF type:complete len:220 (+),score=63.55 TRINITY_DN11268_c0_g1_i2:31-690(+)